MRNSVVTAENLAGTTSLISLFLLPVTFANTLFSVFAGRKLFNKLDRRLNDNKITIVVTRFAINAALE